MNFRTFLSTLTAIVAALATGQSVSIHTSGDNGMSWALIRVSGGGSANVGEVGGVHIGQITHDDLFIVRDGKAYELRDESVMRRVEQTEGPVDKIREQRQKVRDHWREARQQERGEERERRNLDRSKQRLERSLDRSDDATRTDIQHQMSDLDHQMADIDRQIKAMTAQIDAEQKRVDAFSKTLDNARNDRRKKVEAILSEAIDKGVAKPYP